MIKGAIETYNVKQAINLDGGASSVMAYGGKTINKPCTSDKNGRDIPNIWAVSKNN